MICPERWSYLLISRIMRSCHQDFGDKTQFIRPLDRNFVPLTPSLGWPSGSQSSFFELATNLSSFQLILYASPACSLAVLDTIQSCTVLRLSPPPQAPVNSPKVGPTDRSTLPQFIRQVSNLEPTRWKTVESIPRTRPEACATNGQHS